MAEKLTEKEIFSNLPFHCTYLSKINYTTENHHHDFFEFFLVTRGSIIHLVNNEIQELNENSLVFIRPEDTHYFQKIKNQKCYFLNLAFLLKIPNSFFLDLHQLLLVLH